MATWFSENASTIIISIILVLLIMLAARSIYRTRKSGGCSGCSGCNHDAGSDNDNTTFSCHSCDELKQKK